MTTKHVPTVKFKVGDDWLLAWQISDSATNAAVDLSDYQFSMSMRRYRKGTDVWDWSQHVDSDPINGLLVMWLTRTETSDLGLGPYVWDLSALDLISDLKLTIYEGTIVATQEVTTT